MLSQNGLFTIHSLSTDLEYHVIYFLDSQMESTVRFTSDLETVAI